MPIYESSCQNCGATGTYYRKIADRHDTPACSECGGKTRQIISAVKGFGDLPAYESPIDGREIRGRRARAEDLKRSGCREYEGRDVELREAARRRAEIQAKREARLDESIERTITELDASNKLERVSERVDQLPDLSNMRILNG
jgi:putative FmdB family regulatory protein